MQQSAFEASAQRSHLQHRGCVIADKLDALLRCQAADVEIPMQKLITALRRQCRVGDTVKA